MCVSAQTDAQWTRTLGKNDCTRFEDFPRSLDVIATGVTMSHHPPKENKKQPALNPKQKKAAKQQKKQAQNTSPFLKT